MSKPADLFVGDIVNMLIYSSIAIGISMLTLSDRVESVENYTVMQDRADKDALTSIMNRGAGERAVINQPKNGHAGSFIMVDIDDFKYFNDEYGHDVGDEVIYAVSTQLKKEFRNTDIVLRLGGDEFAALFFADAPDVRSNPLPSHQNHLGIQIRRTSQKAISSVHG